MRFFFLSLTFIILCVSMVNGEVLNQRGQAYFDYAVFAFEDKNYDEAEKNLKLALELNSGFPVYQHYLAKVYLETGQYDKAMYYLKEAEKGDSGLSGVKADIAFVYYRQKDFQKAADIFKLLADKSSEDAFLQYYAGLCLSEIKQCEDAVKYFTRASEISSSVRVKGDYALGVCYQDIGKREKAVEKFKQVKNALNSGEMGASAEKWLEPEQAGTKSAKPYTVFAMLSRIYDDNVGLQSEDQEFFTDEDDWGTGAYIFGSYNFIKQNNFKAGAGIDIHHTRYDDLSEFDQTGSILSLYSRYSMKPLFFGLNYYLFFHWLDSESSLRSHHIKPDITWKINENLTSCLSYSFFKDNDFLDRNRDGEMHSSSLKLLYKLPFAKTTLSAGIRYEKKDAFHPDDSFHRMRSHVGLFIKLPWELELGIMGKYADKKYENTDSKAGITRNDDKYSASASISRNIYKDWLNLAFEYRYINNDSNIRLYDYTNNQTIISLSAGF
ncbi:surface lipoprotein assembly modifier [Desulfobacterales bacterium HSG17]|nr:surface lipoprotein assembly modifier [Desulfobacterales bacterium HSG17]